MEAHHKIEYPRDGRSKTHIFKVWARLRDRCYGKPSIRSKHYGDLGIKMAEEWDDFYEFKSWAESHGYQEHFHITRHDKTKDFSPENCYWIDPSTKPKCYFNITHNMAHSKIKKYYDNFHSRCYNPKTKEYPNYGGKGIKMCDEWYNSKESFFNWAINNGYEEGYYIRRIDNTKDFSPENCEIINPQENETSFYWLKTHNLSKTRLFGIWSNMKDRCYNLNCKAYKDYGGRGIKICDEWKDSFISFHDWAIENGYKETLTIDRINVNGNYEPNNCRWTTVLVQNRNRRSTKYITFRGEKLPITEFCEKYHTTRTRVRKICDLNLSDDEISKRLAI